MFNKKKGEEKKGAPMWMTTFSDLMTLILVFFILLFSFSEIDATKFRMIANSFRGTFENMGASPFFDNPPSSPVDFDKLPQNTDMKKRDSQDEKDQAKEEEELNQLLFKIKSYLQEHNLEGQIQATKEKKGITLVLQENVLFDPGRAVVKQRAKPFLSKISELIESLPNKVEIEGHTDSIRIQQPSRYTSNWNLSGDRAANVVNYFVKERQMPSARFLISGYADTEPVASNNTISGRQKNRRAVIIILDSHYTQ